MELTESCRQCLEEMGSIWKCSKGFPRFLEAVQGGCDSWLLEKVQSFLLILCTPSPACAREMSLQVLTMKFRQPLPGLGRQGQFVTFISCLWESGGVSDVLTLCHACCDTEKVACAVLVWSKEDFLLHFTPN